MQGDTNLGIRISVAEQGAESVSRQIAGLQRQLTQIASLQASTASSAGSAASAMAAALSKEEAAIKANLAALRESIGVKGQEAAIDKNRLYDLQRQVDIYSQISNKRDQDTRATLAQAAATQRLSAAQAESNRLYDLQRRLAVASATDPMALRSLSTAALIRAQRGVDEMGAPVGMSAAQLMRAQRATAAMSEPSGRGEVSGFFNTAQTLAAQRNFQKVLRDLKDDADKGGEEVGQSFFRRFFSPRTLVTFGDEFSRGQRGQLTASIGAAFKRATPEGGLGAGGIALGAGIGAAAVVGFGGVAAVHAAKAMAELAENTHAAAMAAGMSIQQYSSLQGALILTGSKVDAARVSLVHFASVTGKAMANPLSQAAQALHNMGISQDEIIRTGNDSYAMFIRVAGAMRQQADGSVKAQEAVDLFGRSDAAMMKLLDKSAESFQGLINKAGPYAAAMRENAKANEEMGEKLSEATLKWDTLKIRASGALSTIIDWLLSAQTALLNFKQNVVDVATAFGKMAASIEDYIYKHTGGFFGLEKKAGPPKLTASVSLDDVDVRPKPSPYGGPRGRVGGGDHREYTGILDEQKAKLRELRQEYQNFSEQQTALFDHQRVMVRMQRADKELSPVQAALEELSAYKAANASKIAELNKFKAASDAAYDTIIAAAKKADDADAARGKASVRRYETEMLNKQSADVEFYTKQLKLQDEVENYKLKAIEAHRREVEKVVKEWGDAFDRIGTKIEDTIGEAIKSAFSPQKPEYWWSSRSGPHGQPLMVPHRVDPTMQLLGSAGMSIAGDIGKQLQSSLMTSISKSIFGEGTSGFGAGLAGLIGIGKPGGLFGSGLGAVSDIGKDVAVTANTTAIGLLTAAVTANTAAVSAGAVSGAASGAGSAIGGIGGAVKGISSLVGLAAAPETGGLSLIASIFGGVAARGWAIPSFAAGGVVNVNAHGGEHILPSDIARRYEAGAPGGGDMHLHFHGPADAPSMDRWFKNMMSSNPGVVRNFFRQNQLTFRTT